MSWIATRTAGACRLLGMLLLWVALSAPAGAALHEATVPVADRSEAARQQAVRAALAEVLVRLSGDPALPQQAGSAPLLAEAGRYLQQYQYEGSEGAGTLMLRAGFDAAALEAQLRRQGVTLWGRERPPLLVWLAVDDGQRRYLLGADDADPVLAELRAAARRESLELVLPLLDLEDQSRVSFTGIWGGDLASAQQASQRYRAQAVLIGGLQRSADGWKARWALRHAGRDSAWQSAGADPAGAFESGLRQANAGLVVRSAAAPASGATTGPTTGPAPLTLVVEEIYGLADYVRVDGHLRGLAPVRSAELVAVQGRRMEFRVDVQGGAPGLDQALLAGGVLEPERSAVEPAGASVYRLRR